METTEQNPFDIKLDINLNDPEDITFKFQKIDIIVRPYITMETKYILIDGYANVLNSDEYDDTRKYVEAEYALKLGIIQHQTNVDIEKNSIDKILSSGLYKAVIANIYNYDELKVDIAEIVNRVNDSKSASKALTKLTDKVIMTLDQLSKVDLSEDGVKKLLSALNEEKEKLNNYIPVVNAGEKVPTISKRKPKNNVVL
jgi:hypothetical protein